MAPSSRRNDSDMGGRKLSSLADAIYRSSYPLHPLGEGGSFQVYETLVKLAVWKRARQEAKGFPRPYAGEARDRAKFQILRPH